MPRGRPLILSRPFISGLLLYFTRVWEPESVPAGALATPSTVVWAPEVPCSSVVLAIASGLVHPQPKPGTQLTGLGRAPSDENCLVGLMGTSTFYHLATQTLPPHTHTCTPSSLSLHPTTQPSTHTDVHNPRRVGHH